MTQGRLLYLDSSDPWVGVVRGLLAPEGVDVISCTHLEMAQVLVARESFDLILCNEPVWGGRISQWVDALCRQGRNAKIIDKANFSKEQLIEDLRLSQ